MARKGASLSTRAVGFLVLCLTALVLFVLVHVRSFFHLTSLHDASAPAVGEPTSTQLRARLELLTGAMKDTSAKLQALEAKERAAGTRDEESAFAADAKPPPATTTSTGIDFSSSSSHSGSDGSSAAGPPAQTRQTGHPKAYFASSGFHGHPILTLSDEELRSGYAVSDLMAW